MTQQEGRGMRFGGFKNGVGLWRVHGSFASHLDSVVAKFTITESKSFHPVIKHYPSFGTEI